MEIYEPKHSLIQFTSVPDSLDEAHATRVAGWKRKCPTGNRFLDKALGGGVGSSDLLLLAAPPGTGKTECALAIATHNASLGRNVFMFALEAERFEITNRLFYRELANLYFESLEYRPTMVGKKLNYADWMDGKFSDALKDLEAQTTALVRDKFKTLSIFYRDRNFGIEELTKQVLSVNNKADLIIIDHLHYIDGSPNENENVAMTALMKAIRDMALICEKPFILVAHVRKRDSRAKSLLPDLEDIHGSSNLAKIATKAVMLAPCYDPTQRPGEYFTYMRVVKNRRDGSRCRYTAVCTFDAFRNRYKDEFILGRLTKDGQEFEPIEPEDMPHWIKD